MSAVGDGWPDSGGPPDELPDLPPGWGPIIIPDDPAELASEAVAVRRELRRRRRRGIPQTVPLGTPARDRLATLRAPLLITTLTVLATLVSLIGLTWPRPTHRPAAAQATSPATAQTASVTAVSGRTLPALDLVDADGGVVSLRGLLPAVIILTDGCDCGPELAAAVGAAPPGVTVVEVTGGRSVPNPPPDRPSAVAAGVHRLADPVGELRSFLRASVPADADATLLVARSGHVVRVLPTAAQVPGYPADLARLAAG